MEMIIRASELRQAGVVIAIYDSSLKHVDCDVHLQELSESDLSLWRDHLQGIVRGSDK